MLDQAQSAISSYLGWWHDAGYAVPVAEQPVNWLLLQDAPVQNTAPKHEDRAPARDAITPAAAAGGLQAGRVAKPASQSVPPGVGTLGPADRPTQDTLDAWLASTYARHALAGEEGPSRIFGPADAQMLILTDMPDRGVDGSPSCLSPAGHQLMTVMLKAAGVDITQGVRIAPMAPVRPAGGQLDSGIHSILVEIAHRHIMAVAPKQLLIVGQQTLSILATIPMPIDGVVKPNVNHDVANMASFAIHHPRLLLERPMLKRQAWQAIKRMREQGSE